MYFLLGFFIFIFGTIIGSFLNVVIFRHNTGVSLATGRSMCFSCGKTLDFFDLIPVLSFIFLGGRCRYCKTKISKQYILVELVTGLLFLGLFLQGIPLFASVTHFALWFLFYATIFSLFTCIGVYDYYHKIIPNTFVYPLILLSCIGLFFVTPTTFGFHIPTFLDVAAGLIVPFPVAALFFLSHGRYIGFADAKLFMAVGWFLGLVLGVSAFVLSFWIGGAMSLLLILFTKTKIGMKSEIPFGPYIIIATLIIFFTHIDVLGLSIFFDSIV